MATNNVSVPSGKDLINAVPGFKQQWRVSEVDILKISALLGKGWWEMFAQVIGFNKVENIKSNYDELDHQKYQLMLQWNSKLESKATYEIVLNALSNLNQIDALDEVCKLLHGQSEPGRPLPSVLERYSDTLKRRYSEYKLKAIVDWPPPSTETIVKLAMVGDPQIDLPFIHDMTRGNLEDVLKKKTPIEPEKLYEELESGSGKVILLEGAPGSGKSTMCWYICKQWGEGKLLEKLNHILMIEMYDKEIQKAKCLDGILPYCEAEEKRVTEELIKKQGENVLVILEGWNELPKELQNESIFKDLVTKSSHSPLQKAVILVSSRSNASINLHRYTTLHMEVLGFTPDQVEKYIEGCFTQPYRAEELLTIINRNPKLRENCYLPLMVIIIVHLYHCSKTLPESLLS